MYTIKVCLPSKLIGLCSLKYANQLFGHCVLSNVFLFSKFPASREHTCSRDLASGGIVVLTWSHVRGGTVAKIFAPGGGLSWSGKNFRSGHPKIKLFLAFLARSARKIFLRGSILSWPGLFQRGESCPDLDFFRGGSTTTFWTSGGGLSWPVIDPCTCMKYVLKCRKILKKCW